MKRNPKLIVTLSSVGNPDHEEYCGANVLSPDREVEVKDFAEASEICRAYITHYKLGGGNWTGGEVRQGERIVARISYNGRVWPVPDKG